MELYKDEKHTTVTYNKEQNYLTNIWNNMAIPVDRMEKLQAKNFETIKKYGITSIISDMKDARSAILPDTLDYYIKVVEPTLASLGIKLIVSVKSDNLITDRTNQRWYDATKDINLVEVGSLEEAEDIIKEHKLIIAN